MSTGYRHRLKMRRYTFSHKKSWCNQPTVGKICTCMAIKFCLHRQKCYHRPASTMKGWKWTKWGKQWVSEWHTVDRSRATSTFPRFMWLIMPPCLCHLKEWRSPTVHTWLYGSQSLHVYQTYTTTGRNIARVFMISFWR